MNKYKQFDLDDRKNIEEGLNKRLSFRAIAKMLKRPASSVSREVRSNRTLIRHKSLSVPCKDKETCVKKSVCDTCAVPGAVCARCNVQFCQEVCVDYIAHYGCKNIVSAPWVCNGCRRRNCGCNRSGRYEYTACVADKKARDMRSVARQGVNRTEEDFERVMGIVRPAIARGMSPYEVAISYADTCKVSQSTLYRWVDRGYGGMANLELERKVGFKPRKQHVAHKITHHGKSRSYAEFLKLADEERASACEMDTVIGRKVDSQCLLTLYLRPSHMQFCLLLEEKTEAEVVRAFDNLEGVCGKELFKELFSLILTDNGTEFEDPEALEKSVHFKGKRSRVFYCDPRQSQQKAGCEKNHTELRQILPKGRSIFDALKGTDIAVLNSQINSTPRKSLCGMSPLKMLKAAFGKRIDCLLDALDIQELAADELHLKPSILPDAIQVKPTN